MSFQIQRSVLILASWSSRSSQSLFSSLLFLDESINRRLFNDVIQIEKTEEIVELDTFKCLEATFTIVNEKGHLESPVLRINLERVNALAPSIKVTTGQIGDLTIGFENEEFGLGNKWNDASIYVCFR